VPTVSNDWARVGPAPPAKTTSRRIDLDLMIIT
jgi:hypothetical protein